MRIIGRLALLAIIGLPPQSLAGETPKPTAADHPWAGFKPGSFVELSIGTKVMKAKSSQTLMAVSADTVTLAFSMSIDGQPASQRTEIEPLGSGFAPADPKAERLRTEKCRLGKKRLTCTVWRFKQTGREQIERTEWLAPGVALPIRIHQVVRTMGQTIVTDLKAVKPRARLKVAGKTLVCMKMKGQSQVGQLAPIETVRWVSAQVPGWLVKEVRSPGTGNQATTIVTAFSAKR